MCIVNFPVWNSLYGDVNFTYKHNFHDALIQLLLYGDHDLSNDLNRSILELTLRFIHETGRFD